MVRLLLILSLMSVSSCAVNNNAGNWKRGGCVRVTGDKPAYSPSEAVHFERNTPKPSMENEYLLGLMYGELSRNPDWKKSAYWMQKSAQAGYPYAKTSLGKLYLNGTGVPKNVEEAYFWLSAGKSYNCDDVGPRISSERLLTTAAHARVEQRLRDAGCAKDRPVNWQ